MKKMGEQLDTFRDAGSRAGEVCIRVYGICLRSRHLRQLRGQLHGFLQSIAAWRNDYDLGRLPRHVRPFDAYGISACPSERVPASRQSDHLGNPVPRAEKGLRPFEEYDLPRNSPAHGRSDCIDSISIRPDHSRGLALSAERSSNGNDVLIDLGDASRREKQDFGLRVKFSNGSRELITGRSTHATEVLRENHIRAQLLQQHLIDRVKRIARAQPVGDRPIDSRG